MKQSIFVFDEMIHHYKDFFSRYDEVIHHQCNPMNKGSINTDQINIYLHRETVDFRKAINGLSLIVEDVMSLSPFKRAIFVFCNKNRSQLKVLYWDDTGFVLWQKRLEKSRFKWLRNQDETPIELTHEQWGYGFCTALILRK